MAGITFSRMVTNWDHLSGAVKPRLEELPELAEPQETLERLTSEAKSLLLEQESLKGRLRQAVRRRQELEVEGEDARARLAALVQGKLGLRNETLIGFGIAPRLKRRRKSKEARAKKVKPQAAPPKEAPPPTETTAAE